VEVELPLRGAINLLVAFCLVLLLGGHRNHWLGLGLGLLLFLAAPLRRLCKVLVEWNRTEAQVMHGGAQPVQLLLHDLQGLQWDHHDLRLAGHCMVPLGLLANLLGIAPLHDGLGKLVYSDYNQTSTISNGVI
jgi:hypothetical protein